MKRFSLLTTICLGAMLLLSHSIFAQKVTESLEFFIPDEITTFDPAVPTPKQFLGYEIGDRFVTYDQTLAYMRLLAQSSDRVQLIENGKSYEQNPLVFLIISSPKNLSKLEEHRQQHLDLCNPQKSKQLNISNMPMVTWLGYSVHGNEASAINASLVVAYTLLASTNEQVLNMLDSSIIILQPGLNPDGIQRYATWANNNISKTVNGDSNTRAYKEPTPSGRSNHYWFDLNRDWLFVQHPESYHRMEVFHQWLPTLANDYHEHGGPSGGFFSPGLITSTNPLIPEMNWHVSEKVSKYHARMLDELGSLYFSKEGYDDFYPSKGATIPDLVGGIGLLYEQPNLRGLYRERGGVLLRFVDMVQNQVYCSFATLKAGLEMKDELLSYQRDFFVDKQREAEKSSVQAYVFGSKGDVSLSKELIHVLNGNDISTYALSKDVTVNGKKFEKGYAYVVPLNQRAYPLICAIFEKNTTYIDTTFYDISAWTMPLAFNISYAELTSISDLKGEKVSDVPTFEYKKVEKSSYAYLFEIGDYYSYNFMYYLLSSNVELKVANKPFTIPVEGKDRSFSVGSILIPVKDQRIAAEELHRIINTYEGNARVEVLPVTGGLGKTIDLGSPSFKRVEKPSVAMLVGKGATYSGVGEIWHLLDWRLGIPLSIIDADNLESVDISRYNIIVANGHLKPSKEASAKLAEWSKSNTLITFGAAYRLANDLGVAEINTKKESADKKENDKADKNVASASLAPFEKQGVYTDYISKNSKPINGVILACHLDSTHPISYGMGTNSVSIFKQNSTFIAQPTSKYITPVYFTKNPLQSGYLTDKVAASLKETPAVLATKNHIYFTDDPYFRAFWLGSSRLFLNSIFFRDLMPSGKIKTGS